MTTSTQGRASRRKGATFERAIVAYLRRLGIPADRTSNGRAQAGHGDIDGLPALHLEVKNQTRLDLAGWVDQARHDAAGTGRTPVVVVKRRGVLKPGASYVVLELGPFLALLGVTEPSPPTGAETTPKEGTTP